MSLVVVACLALVFGGIVAWLTRLNASDLREAEARLRLDHQAFLADVAAGRDEMRREREALLAYVERSWQSAREERREWADRIQNPLGVAAAHWPVPEAQKQDTELEKADRDWLESEDSEIPWDSDLLLADTEVG